MRASCAWVAPLNESLRCVVDVDIFAPARVARASSSFAEVLIWIVSAIGFLVSATADMVVFFQVGLRIGLMVLIASGCLALTFGASYFCHRLGSTAALVIHMGAAVSVGVLPLLWAGRVPEDLFLIFMVPVVIALFASVVRKIVIPHFPGWSGSGLPRLCWNVLSSTPMWKIFVWRTLTWFMLQFVCQIYNWFYSRFFDPHALHRVFQSWIVLIHNEAPEKYVCQAMSDDSTLLWFLEFALLNWCVDGFLFLLTMLLALNSSRKAEVVSVFAMGVGTLTQFIPPVLELQGCSEAMGFFKFVEVRPLHAFACAVVVSVPLYVVSKLVDSWLSFDDLFATDMSNRTSMSKTVKLVLMSLALVLAHFGFAQMISAYAAIVALPHIAGTTHVEGILWFLWIPFLLCLTMCALVVNALWKLYQVHGGLQVREDEVPVRIILKYCSFFSALGRVDFQTPPNVSFKLNSHVEAPIGCRFYLLFSVKGRGLCGVRLEVNDQGLVACGDEICGSYETLVFLAKNIDYLLDSTVDLELSMCHFFPITFRLSLTKALIVIAVNAFRDNLSTAECKFAQIVARILIVPSPAGLAVGAPVPQPMIQNNISP